MTNLLYLSEIMNFAIEREEESYSLYKHLHSIAKTDEAKNLFSTLMNDENAHKIFYTNMLNNTTKEQSPGAPKNDEYLSYLKELIDSSRTAVPLDIDKVNDVAQAIDYAIEREKDAIIFYTILKNYIDSADKDQIDKIIQAEGKHISRLNMLKKNMNL